MATGHVADRTSALHRTDERGLPALAAPPETCVFVFDADLRVVPSAGDALTEADFAAVAVDGRRVVEVLPTPPANRLELSCRAALRGQGSTFGHVAREGVDSYETSVAPCVIADEIVRDTLIWRDITGGCAAEAAMATSERRYRELAEYSSDVISRSDAEGIYRYVSPACVRAYGWTPEQMVGRRVRDFLHPDDLAHDADVRAVLGAGADEQVADFRFALADGGWVWSEVSYSVQRDADGSIREVQAAARDISERVAAADLRRTTEGQFRSAFEDAPIGIALVDLDGGCLRVNPALCAILGYSAEELSGRAFDDITHPDDRDAEVELLGQLLTGRVSSYTLEKRYRRADRATVWAKLSVSLARDERGNARHLVSQVEDITDRKRLEGELERLANRDDLTGLHNRRFFEQALEEQLRRVERYREQAAVLMLDLDDFKSVNDTLGHHAGDQLLKHVGKVASERLRSSDVLARLGGDEFAVLLPYADDESAADVAAALQVEFARQPARIEGQDILACASIGVAVLAADDSIDDALRRADRAMYHAKRAYCGR